MNELNVDADAIERDSHVRINQVNEKLISFSNGEAHIHRLAGRGLMHYTVISLTLLPSYIRLYLLHFAGRPTGSNPRTS